MFIHIEMLQYYNELYNSLTKSIYGMDNDVETERKKQKKVIKLVVFLIGLVV